MTDSFPSNLLLSCDWGTSTFRLRLVRRSPLTVLEEVRSDEGAQRLAAGEPAEREAAYRLVLARGREELNRRTGLPLGEVPTVISGMAGATIGWRELPYTPVPVTLSAEALRSTEVESNPMTVLVSGVCTRRDVMRGEETEILGLMALPEYAELRERSLLILPGTHSKHVRVERGQICDFVTHLTGELWALLTGHSTLGHAATAEIWRQELRSETREPFGEGVVAAQTAPLTAELFQVRAHQVLLRWEEAANAAYLRGLLLGVELGRLGQEGAADEPVLLAAGPLHAPWYVAALEVLGSGPRVTVVPEAEMGLAAVRGHLEIARTLGL